MAKKWIWFGMMVKGWTRTKNLKAKTRKPGTREGKKEIIQKIVDMESIA